MLVTKLEEVEARRGKVLIGASGTIPLVVRGPYGFGRVTVVALDVDQSPFATWEDRPLFWVKALDLRLQVVDDAGVNSGVAGGGRLYQSNVSDLSTQLRRALEQFPGVTLIPFGWVAFFIFLYILLIGPGDYLFLKKVLKRMELTWITFPTIVVTVSVLAYYAAYAVKGNELRVNQVEIVDVDQTAGLVRGNTFLTLFSPQNRDYDVSVLPLPLDRAARPRPRHGSDAPARAPLGTEVILSWFGVPEPGFGGMGGNNQFRFASGGYSYEPVGGAEALSGVRVPIWSTRSFSARWFGPGPSVTLVDAALAPVGTDRLSGTVTNRLDVPLEDAHLAFGQQVYTLGTLAPGATIRVELTQDRNLSGYLKANMGRYLSNQPWNAQDFRINRSDLSGRPDVPRQRRDGDPGESGRQHSAALPRPDRPARARPADARRPDRASVDPPGPGPRPACPADRSDHDAPRHPAARGRRGRRGAYSARPLNRSIRRSRNRTSSQSRE